MQGSINFDGSLVGNITGGGGGGGDEVIITPVVTSGTKIADVSVNGVEKDLYCPTPPAPTEVDITPVVTSGTKIADVSVNGVEKDLYCPTPAAPTEVDITPVVTSGTKIADVSIGEVEKDLYAPDYGADITALDDRLDTAEYNITGLTTRMGTAEGNITGLTTRIGTAEDNITALGIECDTIATDLAASYDEEETYSVGDYCTHDKVLYICNTAINTPEEWNISHWNAVKVTEDITEIKQSLLQYWTASETPTVPAGTSGDLEFNIPAAYQSGYRVASYAIYSGSKVIKPYVFDITSTKILYYIENTSGGSIARQITIKVLFQKV